MSGGTISGNNATYGGGVYCYKKMTMSGSGTISGNTAAYGGVYIGNPKASKSEAYNVGFDMSGNSVISNNTATEDGGGLYLNPAIKSSTNSAYRTEPNTVLIYGDSQICNNTANRGGGIFSYDCGFTVKDNGKISENKAKTYGGGVFVHQKRKTAIYDDLKVKMTGESIISNNTAAYGGGVYLLWEDAAVNPTISNADKTSIEMTISGSSIISNNNANCGGAVYLNNMNRSYGTVTFKIEDDSTIIENTAKEKYGGVYNHESVLWFDHSGSIYSNDQCDLFMDYSFILKNATDYISPSQVMVVDFNENILEGDDCDAKTAFAWIRTAYKDIPVEKYFELVKDKEEYYYFTIIDKGGNNNYIYIKAKHDLTGGECTNQVDPAYTEEGEVNIICNKCEQPVKITLPMLTDEDFWEYEDFYDDESEDQTYRKHKYIYTAKDYPQVKVEVEMEESREPHEAHQACGEVDCDHEHAGENIIWMPIWNEDDLLNMFDNCYYYLCDDITLTDRITLQNKKNFMLEWIFNYTGQGKRLCFLYSKQRRPHSL